jgi:hypothetical protein
MADRDSFDGEIVASTKEDLNRLREAVSSCSSTADDHDIRFVWGEVETDRGVFEHFDVLQFVLNSGVGITLNLIASAIYGRVTRTHPTATLSAEPDGSYKISIGSSSVYLAISDINEKQQSPKAD